MTFTNLAQWKKALAVGSRWQYRFAAMKRSDEPASPMTPHISGWMPREVIRLQSNAVVFSKHSDPDEIRHDRQQPHGRGTWLEFPKASACTFPEPGVVRIANGDADHWLEYRVAPPDQVPAAA